MKANFVLANNWKKSINVWTDKTSCDIDMQWKTTQQYKGANSQCQYIQHGCLSDKPQRKKWMLCESISTKI